MEQGQARRRAREIGGIAVEAVWRPAPPDGGHWLLGGWPGQKDATWIVVSTDMKTVLDDRER